MKIVIAMPSFYGQSIGGAEYQSYLIANELIQRGHDVHYIYISDSNPIRKKLNGCTLHPLKKIRNTNRTGLQTILYFMSIVLLLKRIKPNVIYTRGRSAVSLICSIYAGFTTTKSVWHISHDNNLLQPRLVMSFKEIIRYPEQKLFLLVLQFFDKIIAQTKFQADRLLLSYNLKSYVIPNGQSTTNLNINKKNQDKIRILWIANMKPFKQPEIFVRLANTIENKKDYLFVMIGRISKNKELCHIINNTENLVYLGEVTNKIVNEYLSKGHILVNTSLSEGFSNTFIQAWMRGVPVISLNVDPDNIIKNEGIGFHSGCFEQMVKDVINLCKSHRLRMIMGNKAHKYAIEKYSIQNIKKVVDIILS